MRAYQEASTAHFAENGFRKVYPITSGLLSRNNGEAVKFTRYPQITLLQDPDISVTPIVQASDGRITVTSTPNGRRREIGVHTKVVLHQYVKEITVGEGISVAIKLRDGSEVSVQNGSVVTREGEVDVTGEKVMVTGQSEDEPLYINIREEDAVRELILRDNTRLNLPGVNTDIKRYVTRMTVLGENNRRTKSGEPLRSFEA